MRTDDDGAILRANRMFCDWLGYAPADLAGTRRLQDLLSMGGRIFHQTHWAPLLRMQGSVSEVKLELVHADGTRLPMVLNAVRRPHAGGYVHDIAAFVARDRDRYEQELLLSRKRLEELHAVTRDRAQFAEQMIGIVSHDLRNPLGTIRIAAEVLAGVGDKTCDRVAPRIVRAVERANRLISELLDFAQARVGSGLAVSIAPVDVHRAAAQIVDDLQGAHPTRRLVHQATGPGDCELDENRLSQLIGNLVGNAVAYGAAATPITVVTAVTDDAVAVSVHNLGAPIPPAIIGGIFEPMTRGTTEHSQARSVGLGLYIVREIAKAHGGRASVTSTADAGTTFTVAMPRRRAVTEPAPP
nr:PAS domain-containing sensor histidine kinase [Kofleriaceae bacterium]